MTNRRIFAGIGLVLVIIAVLGNLLARRLAVFSPDELIITNENPYTLDSALTENIAILAQGRINAVGPVEGSALLAAEQINIDSDIQQDLTAIGERVAFEGTVGNNAMFLAEQVSLDGTVRGRTVVVAERLSINGGEFNDGLVVCVEQTANSAEVEILPCDRAAAQDVLRRAASQVASVGVISLLNNPQAFNAFNLLLPLPMGLVFAGIATLIVTIFPVRTNKMEAAVRTKPGQMLVTGVLLALMMVGLTALWLVLLAYIPPAAALMLPLYLLVAVGFVLLLTVGWVTLALALGGWITRRVSSQMIPPMVLTVFGGIVLAFAAFGISWLPLGDWLVSGAVLVLGWAGLGAAFATRLGQRSLVFV